LHQPENPGAYFSISGLLSGQRPGWLYDPSNGTVSFGVIMRTNKGEVTGNDIK